MKRCLRLWYCYGPDKVVYCHPDLDGLWDAMGRLPGPCSAAWHSLIWLGARPADQAADWSPPYTGI
jgi:hypothetical protein